LSSAAHATVATIGEQQGRFLMVEEICHGRLVVNQPAGHVEPGERLKAAAIRETLEETAHRVELTGVVGFYSCEGADNGVTYHRVCFAAKSLEQLDIALDDDIERTVWLTREQIFERRDQWRSPMVLACVDDYLQNRHFPLALIRDL